MKTNYLTNIDPINYDYAAQEDRLKHVYFKDYKHLKDVTWSDSESNIVWSDVFGAIMLIVAMLAISTVLFLN